MKDSLSVFVLGPTGVGKSKHSLNWARHFDSEIINADSLQVFKYLDIGTAKPSMEQRKLCKHHLFDFVSPPETYTAGSYYKQARKLIHESQKRLLFVVGGSGFYMNSLEKGMPEIPEIPEDILVKVKEKIQNTKRELLYEELKKKDPIYASKIQQEDSYRIYRAFCLLEFLKKPISEIYKLKKENKIKCLKIGLLEKKENLDQNLKKRIDEMLQKGLIEEVKTLVEKGYKDWPPLKSIGYRQVLEYLDGKIAEKDLAFEIFSQTKKLVKKQITWFKRDPEIKWFNKPLKDHLVIDYIKKFL